MTLTQVGTTPLERGRRCYEQWASALGTFKDFFPWDRLSDEDHKRWIMMAKSGVTPHTSIMREPADVIRFGRDSDVCPNWHGGEVSMWDLISPPAKELEEWKAKRITETKVPWWKFWATAPELDLSEQAYWEFFLPKDGPAHL